MANRKIICDRTEIILLDEGKNDQVHNFTYDQIMLIQIKTCNEFSWFKKVTGEKIEIFVRKMAEPFTFRKRKNRPYFEEYKRELKDFAANHRIDFKDFTGSAEKEEDYQSEAI